MYIGHIRHWHVTNSPATDINIMYASKPKNYITNRFTLQILREPQYVLH